MMRGGQTIFVAFLLLSLQAQCDSNSSTVACNDVKSILLEYSSNTSTTLLRPTINIASFYPTYFYIPTYQQTFNYSCGPSSLLTVLEAFGFKNETELSLMEEMKTNWDVGTNLSQMIDAVARRGLQYTALRDASLADIRTLLSKGELVIILYQAWADEPTPYINVWDSGHFSVVFGMDDANVYVMDPWTGMLGYMEATYFAEARWHAPDDFGDDLICTRCLLSVGPKQDGSTLVLQQLQTQPTNMIFIG